MSSGAGGVRDPLFILAPPRSFSSVICAAIGQHPDMYGLPETSLFSAETVAGWWEACGQAGFPMSHGLLRAVAQIFFGEQTQRTVELARGWLQRRAHMTTGLVLELIAERLQPAILVEKSPSLVFDVNRLQRVYRMFPTARFIHLTRHPRGYGHSVLKACREASEHGPAPRWLLSLCYLGGNDVDPQRSWLAAQRNICQFLEKVPVAQKRQIRGEDILVDPEGQMLAIATWLQVRTDERALEAMKHPEESPYARLGPPGALYGNDKFFLEQPRLRPERAEVQRLDGGLPWRTDNHGFCRDVLDLAERFGYQ